MEERLKSKGRIHSVIYSLWTGAIAIWFASTFFYTAQPNFTVSLFLAILFLIFTVANVIAFFSNPRMYSFNYACLFIFQASLSLIAILGIIIFVQPSTDIRGELERDVNDYLNNQRASIFLDNFQKEMKCCGTFSVLDYKNYVKDDLIPLSCCHENDRKNRKSKNETENCAIGAEYRDGCVQAFRKYTYSYKLNSVIFVLVTQFWQSIFYYWVRINTSYA